MMLIYYKGKVVISECWGNVVRIEAVRIVTILTVSKLYLYIEKSKK